MNTSVTSLLPLALLTALCLLSGLWCTPLCRDQCCRFLEGFPVRLRTLRESFSPIRGYYQEANDNSEIALLDQNVETYFKSPFGCYAMNNVLEFYLRTVFPSAKSGLTDEIRDFTQHMESIELILDELKRQLVQCRNYFSCQKPFDINNLNSTYNEIGGNGGLYKAMGELDVFFNYIETYMATKRQQRA